MKKLLIFIFSILSIAAIAQPGSLSQSVVRFRVNDSTAAIAANVSPIAQGYSPMFWNNQAATPHWDIWNGTSYSHIFDFNGGSGIDGSTALNSYAGSHTLDAGDVNDFNDNGVIRFTIAGPANLTVPLDATVNFDIPSQIGIDNQGSDTLTVVWTGGVTGNDGGYAEIFPGGSALLIKVAANEYDLLGTQPGGGGAGDLTTTNFVFRETPSGTVNGSNQIFTLANPPTFGTEQIFLDGVLQELTTDYTISSANITMIPAPATGSKIRVTYMK